MLVLKEATKLPKLGEGNIRTWKKGMQSVFIIGDLWEELDPLQAPLPPSPGTDPPPPTFIQIKLKHVIQLCCEESAEELISDIDTGREAWKVLLLAYETSNPGDRMAVKENIDKLRMTQKRIVVLGLAVWPLKLADM